MLKTRLLGCLIFAFILAVCSKAHSQEIQSDASIAAQFKQLKQGLSVLYIAAHPDDENTQLLTYLSKVKHFRTAYLSLTRGDGGQNLIGSEQGIALGIVRTHELAQARKIDGAEQFFTRAYDFGYSKTAKETFQNWNKSALLADVVFVIRKFKPTVIITRFDSDGSGGHGQHTASAILAYEAFKLAADPHQFPEQLKYVDTHQCKRLFYNSIANWQPFSTNKANLMALEIGQFIPELGKNTGEIAAESRSMHLSQGFGTEKRRGLQTEYFKAIAGDTTNLFGDLFKGIPSESESIDLTLAFKKYIQKAEKAWQTKQLKQCNTFLFKARHQLIKLGIQPKHHLHKNIQNLLLAVNGIYIESVYKQQELPVAGDSIAIEVEINSRQSNQVVLKNIAIGNKPFILKQAQVLSKNTAYAYQTQILLDTVNASNLYWLNKGLNQNLYAIDLPEIGTDIGSTFSIPVSWYLQIGKDSLYIESSVNQKIVTPQSGETYRTLFVNPPLLLSLPKQLFIAPKGQKHTLALGLKAFKNLQSIHLNIQAPFGWKINIPNPETTLSKAEFKTVKIELIASDSAQTGLLLVEATDSLQTYSLQQEIIEYTHIGKQVYYLPAQLKLYPYNLLSSHKKIGYITGAKDLTPSILKELGYAVELINADKFAEIQLSDYDVLIFGIRSFNLYPQLHQYREKYLSFVQDGGNLLVLYQTNSFSNNLDKTIGPYPFGISKERTTNENAPVQYNAQSVSFLSKPNAIGAADFDNWVQERGIYYANEIDNAYKTPLLISDFNESPNTGAVIQCNYGKGKFTYTGLSFFRQLPAGVNGAVKLLLNLIEQ